MGFQGVLLIWKVRFPSTTAHISQQSTDQQIEGCQELHTIVLEKPRGIMLFLNNSYLVGSSEAPVLLVLVFLDVQKPSLCRYPAEVLWGERSPFSFSAEELRASVCAQLCVCVSSMPVLISDLTIS